MSNTKMPRNKENGKSKYYTDKPKPAQKERRNFVPIHLRTCSDHKDTKLVSAYYPELDLLIIKCPNKFCDQPNAEIEENHKENKEKRRQKWLEKTKSSTPEDTPTN